MQFKLLNFHKMLASFAVNIIGVFVPLIVYTYTGKVAFSLLYMIIQYAFRFLFVSVFRKQMEQKPQLFLLLRAVPILIYASMILVMDYNLWLSVAMICIFGGLSDAFNAFSNEVILNYSSLNKSGKSFGLTRMFEQVGVILSVIMGGLFLDYVSKTIVVVLSITIYIISVIPLLTYYFKYRNTPNFNKEAISNAFLTYGQKPDKSKRGVTASKKILSIYFVMYLLMCFIDALVNLFNLYMFVEYGQFTFASFVSASYNGAFGLSSYFVGKLNEKYDTTIAATIACVVIAVLTMLLPFMKNDVLIIATFAVIGGLSPLYSLFQIERMLIKTRILGISNKALFNRERGIILGKGGGYVMGITFTLLPSFFGIAILFMIYGLLIPSSEEKTRKILINYLQNN